MIASGGKSWFTAAELAELALPGLPRTKRKVNERADGEAWKAQVDASGLPLARARKGRGGGIEFHIELLPAAAKAALVERGILFVSNQTNMPAIVAPGLPVPANDSIAAQSGQIWTWYDGQSDNVKDEAQRRAMILVDVDAYVAAGTTKSDAVNRAAQSSGESASTLWNWLALVKGVPSGDRLPLLAPRRKGGGKQAAIDPTLWNELLSDYLRLSQPPFSDCYRRIAEQAALMGVTLPHPKTLLRRVEAEVPPAVIALKREGKEAVRHMLPPQTRSVADLHAMQIVNIDGHKADVFVNWGKDANGKDIIIRPTIVAIQDVYSRKFLAWRIARSEDTVTARLVFADLFRKWGIPEFVLSDNGRAFASKELTGGARTRFRFKIRDEDPTGILIALGIKMMWALPFRGQSKPIERGFRDFCSAIAKLPAFEGAYTGNTPLAKPENYGERAIPLEEFCRVWDAGIERHNAQLGRRTEMGGGQRSFDQVFDESYARSSIGKATEEQLRMALLAGDHVRTDRATGAVRVLGNSYWTRELAQVAGEKVTIRFDPDDLSLPVHVYDTAGRFLVTAPMLMATGFRDVASANERKRLEKNAQKMAREAARALDLLSADELAERQSMRSTAPVEPSVRPAATRMVRHRGQTAAALKTVSKAAQTPFANPEFEQARSRAALRLIQK